MNLTKLSITTDFDAILFCDLVTALFIKQQITSIFHWNDEDYQGTSLGRNVNKPGMPLFSTLLP